ncbi:MAG: thioesterase family protein [Tumebacillaceae bacterium]
MTEDVLQSFQFYTAVKVRFAETDANGHMSHVSAVIYMEQVRTEFLEALGLFDLKTIEREGKTFVLASQKIDYVQQAYFNDRIRIYARVSRLGTSSMDIDYVAIHEQTRAVLMTGTSTVVHFDQNTQKSTPLPDDLRQRIAQAESRFHS